MVRDIMTRNCATVAPGDDCREATRLMSTQQVRRLPVVEKGKLVGVISLADLARSHRFDMEASQALCEISGEYSGAVKAVKNVRPCSAWTHIF